MCVCVCVKLQEGKSRLNPNNPHLSQFLQGSTWARGDAMEAACGAMRKGQASDVRPRKSTGGNHGNPTIYGWYPLAI